MIPLAYPYVTEEMRQAALATLNTRWIGQGEKVGELERLLQTDLDAEAVAVGSGTDALHLSYILAGVQRGDEVAVPVFTCTATNIPLLWMGAKPLFIDVDERTLNIDVNDLRRKVSRKTKAIVTVDYGGRPCRYDDIFEVADKYNIPVIQDAAHSIGSSYQGTSTGSYSDFTIFSFQAIKHISTGDGGVLMCKSKEDAEKARKIRWFGIDRDKKFNDLKKWKQDIEDIGYKYQMNDITASLAIESLRSLDEQIERRREITQMYIDGIRDLQIVPIIEKGSAYWLLTVLVDERDELMDYLYGSGIEVSQMHYRNDNYAIFKKYKNKCPNMDKIHEKILCLPLHMKLKDRDVDYIISRVRNYYES